MKKRGNVKEPHTVKEEKGESSDVVVELGGVGVVEIWTYSGCGECLQAFVTLGNFVATQVARKVAQCNIPCYGHSSQHFCWRNRCEK